VNFEKPKYSGDEKTRKGKTVNWAFFSEVALNFVLHFFLRDQAYLKLFCTLRFRVKLFLWRYLSLWHMFSLWMTNNLAGLWKMVEKNVKTFWFQTTWLLLLFLSRSVRTVKNLTLYLHFINSKIIEKIYSRCLIPSLVKVRKK
jgi:hypothetical protein